MTLPNQVFKKNINSPQTPFKAIDPDTKVKVPVTVSVLQSSKIDTLQRIGTTQKKGIFRKIIKGIVSILSWKVALLFDTVFFFITFVSVLLIIVVILYYRTYDLAILNDILRNSINEALLVLYATLFGVILFYFVIIPRIIFSTLGQFITKKVYVPKEKIGFLSLFLRNIVGTLWAVILFPYTLFALVTRKKTIPDWISGIPLVGEPFRYRMKRGIFLFLVYSVLTIGIGSFGVYVFQLGPTSFIEKYINHERQVQFYISSSGYTAARVSLEKYKKFNGETDNAWYYSCIIEGHLELTEASVKICETASTKNLSNDQKRDIMVIQANLLRSTDKHEEAVTLYKTLWETLNIRTFDMVNYVYLLDATGDTEKSAKVLDELYTALDTTSVLNTIQEVYFAELYYNLASYQEAYDIYDAEIKKKEINSLSETTMADLYYGKGQCLHHLGKYLEAKEAFIAAKTANSDYTDSADTYIIEIDFRSKKR